MEPPQNPAGITDGGLLGQQPDGVGVTQVVEPQLVLVGPGRFQPGGGEGAMPDAREVRRCQRASGAAGAARAGEDRLAGMAADQFAVGVEGVDRALIEGDDAPAGSGAWS
jgi:hypothetical protein